MTRHPLEVSLRLNAGVDACLKLNLVMHVHRVAAKLHPTDWLENVPQSTNVELLQRRVQLVGGRARLEGTHRTYPFNHGPPILLSDADIKRYESS